MQHQAQIMPSGNNQPLLIQTKITLPPDHVNWVRRERLLKRLDEVLQPSKRLALISAPAGYGKTTLVCVWVHELARQSAAGTAHRFRIVWISLDEQDDTLVYFWKYIAAAVHAAIPEIGQDVALLLQSLPSQPDLTAPITRLLNELAGLDQFVIIVLDDLHTLHSPEIFASIAFWLEHQSERVRLIINTRSDPPIPLGRLRGSGQMIEIRAVDLRFSSEETQTFLKTGYRLSLEPGDIQSLMASTEGWAVGLQMASLAISNQLSPGGSEPRRNVTQFIRDFSGKHQYIIDYLAEEVFYHLPEPIQQFMLQTSILDEMCPGLCARVTRPARTEGEAAAILRDLVRRNLFVFPVDSERTWFRFHQLFADLLQARLMQNLPERIPALHAQAADWYEEKGQIDQAFRHSLAGKDITRAVELVKLHWQPAINRGELDRVFHWLQALPEQYVHGEPALCLAYAWLYWLKGQMDLMAAWMTRAGGLLAGSGTSPVPPGLKGALRVLQSIHTRNHCDFKTAHAYIREALAIVGELQGFEAHLLRGIAGYHQGEVYRMEGDLEAAIQAYRDALPSLKAAGVTLAAASAHVWLIHIFQAQGRLNAAFEESQSAIQYYQSAATPMQPAFGMIFIAAAEVHLERNALTEAEDYLVLAMELGRLSGLLGISREGNRVLASLRLAQGDANGARLAIQEALQAAEKTGVPDLIAEMQAAQAKLWLRLGEIDRVEVWANGRRWGENAEMINSCRESEALAYARLLFARAKPGKAVPWLDSLASQAERQGRLGSLLEVLILRALTCRQLVRHSAARSDLENALNIAASQGYRRIFLDEGRAGYQLLVEVRPKVDDGELAAYCQQILADFERELAPNRKPSLQAPLYEHISQRELEVLHLLAQGLSNREIGDHLYLSEGTIKAHVHTIYGKLGVQNRTQAAARAREHQLI